VLAGEELSYSDEVERCYGVRPAARRHEAYAAVHERLDELLPASGDLAERYEDWRTSRFVPTEDRAAQPGRRRTAARRHRALVDLPAGEALEIEEVSDEPWWAFNYYLGGLRSRVVVNLDVPTTLRRLVELAPTRSTRATTRSIALKEQLLIRDAAGSRSRSSSCRPRASLVSEGVAETGPDLVLDDELAAQLTGALRARTASTTTWRQASDARGAPAAPPDRLDAALMIHEDGATDEEASAPAALGARHPRAGRAQRSLRHRSDVARYVINYSAGGSSSAWVRAIRRGSRAADRARARSAVALVVPAVSATAPARDRPLINGESVEGSETRELVEPATGEPLAAVQLAGEGRTSTGPSTRGAPRSTATGARLERPSARACCNALADAMVANRSAAVRARVAERREGDLEHEGELFGGRPRTFASTPPGSRRSRAVRIPSADRSCSTP
jgi:hypothetical protein